MLQKRQEEGRSGTRSKKAIKAKVTIGTNGNYLRIQFSSTLSQQIWGVKQKYFSLGIIDSSENRLKATQIAITIQNDILAENLDITLNKYLPETRVKKNISNLDEIRVCKPKQLGLKSKQLGLLEIYNKYCDYVKDKLAITTYLKIYRGSFYRIIQKCPQDISQCLEIRNIIVDSCSIPYRKHLLGIVYHAIEWAKLNKLVPEDTDNIFDKYMKDIIVNDKVRKILKMKKLKPSLVREQTEKSGVRLENDPDYKAFTREEAEVIIEAFKDYGYWSDVTKFLFWTGCRHGEAAGLFWGDIAEDFSYIVFQRSYDGDIKISKSTKTGEIRKFPCGDKLKELLARIKPQNARPNDLVFKNKYGNYISFVILQRIWAGSQSTHEPSLIAELIIQGKLKHYLSPYATRHTFINLQLLAGVPINNVAKWVGNSPITILKHYETAYTGIIPAPEV
ncbi:tyrosine-type recombinase/integrase [Nostoc sp. XA010]|uniref:tyrosine-type recombinase/integrase n=1 Tax=Nostoc sp. XA010 TaxID=2780407 RepID=UPI001E4D79CA|nr:tyrosine-type recombinase/integrase [Nostoc sp. XA010]MCC5661776.1 tyrosine-type recombinase/integrase [Nostoc sp. XA010]